MILVVQFDNENLKNSQKSYQHLKHIWTISESTLDTFTSGNVHDHFNIVIFTSKNTNLLIDGFD